MALLLVLTGCTESPYRSRFDQPQAIREFVAKGGDPNTVFHYQRNPKNVYRFLHLAVEKNDADLARFLLEKGADPNLGNYAGETPLMRLFTQPHDLQALEKRIEMIRVLAPVTDLLIGDNVDGKSVTEVVRKLWGTDWEQRLLGAAAHVGGGNVGE